MLINIYTEQVKIHETPLEKIIFDGTQLKIEFDDENEERWCAFFTQNQGFKVTTIDCFMISDILICGKKPQFILVNDNSEWIACLRATLQKTDYTANFLDTAKHYIFPFQDNVVEVVSSSVKIDKLV